MFPGISTELHIFLLWKQDGRGYIILTNLGKEDTRLIRKERVSKRGILDLIMHMSKMLVPIAVHGVDETGKAGLLKPKVKRADLLSMLWKKVLTIISQSRLIWIVYSLLLEMH